MIKKLETTLKNYATKAEELRKTLETRQQLYKHNFIGQYLQDQMKLAKAEQEKGIYDLRESTNKSISEIIEKLREKVTSMAASCNIEALNELNALRGLKLSQGEIEVLAGKHKADYMAMRILSDLASDSGLILKYVSIDDMQDTITEMERRSMDFVKTYNVSGKDQTYKNMIITVKERPFEDYEEALNSGAITVTNRPKAPLTEDQKKAVIDLFKGYESNPELKAATLNVLGMPGEKLLSDYYESISAVE